MKVLFLLLLPMFGYAQVRTERSFDWSKMEMRCAVAHGDGKGNVFTCDYNGTYYPEVIQDTTITKWFVKMEGKDSLFYYRRIVIDTFVWNGKDKAAIYGYESLDKSTIIPTSYTKDTITFNRQVWRSK